MTSVTPLENAAEGLVGSRYKLVYEDGATWVIQITGIGDRSYRLCYEVQEATPAMQVSSMQCNFHLHPITDENHTMIEWASDYPNDCDL